MCAMSRILQSKAGDRHLYAVGRVRALETRFLDRDILRDLIEASTLKEIYNELRDTVYGEAVVETEENFDFERMLNLETHNLIHLVDSISPDPDLTDLLVFYFDIQNLKMLFKSELAKAPAPENYYTLGRFPIALLREIVQGKGAASPSPEQNQGPSGEKAAPGPISLPDWMIAAAEEVRAEWTKSPKLRVVDAVLDRALARIQLEGAQKAGRPILAKFFSSSIDLYNVETFIRIRITDRSREQFDQFFIPGGSLSVSFFREAWETRIREISRHFEKTAFHTLVVKSIEEYQVEGSLTMLEMEGSRLSMEQLAPSRYITFGPEPILAYFVTRIFEIKILRRIMVAKKNNLSVEELRKRVMTFYAG